MTEFILTLASVFIAAGVLLLVANHLRFPAVPFYILAGLAIGRLIEQDELIILALFGIAFLVFVFGSRIDLGDITSVLRHGEAAAFIQLIIVAPIAFAVGYALGDIFAFEDPFRNALYFSAAATLSSTLVGAKVLEEGIRKNLVYGRLAASIHFFDDVIAIGVLLVLSAEVLTDTQLVTSKIGFGVLFILAGLLVSRHGYPLLIRAAGGGDELVLMGSISLLMAFLAAAEYVGISIVIGAFAAGIAVRSEGPASLGVRNGIESIKDFFAAIFFVTVGALVAVPSIEVVILAVALVLLVVVLNPFIHTMAFIFEGYDGRTGFLAGSSLNQVSELALVIAIQAWLLETIAPTLFDAIILAAAVTMILSAIAGRYEQAVFESILAPFLSERTGYIDRNSQVDEELSDHVVIIGYGRHGRRIVQQLEELKVPYAVIENDPTIRVDLESDCANFVFGDAIASYPLERARVANARMVISTVEHRPVSEMILSTDSEARIILRASNSREAEKLLDEGADFVSVASLLAADQLVEHIKYVINDETELDSLAAQHLDYLQMVELSDLEQHQHYRV